jgi:endoglucanase
MNHNTVLRSLTLTGLFFATLVCSCFTKPAYADERSYSNTVTTKNFKSKNTKTNFRGMSYAGESLKDIQDLAALGANFIAYQIIWAGPADTATLQEYDTWLANRLQFVDQLVNQAEALNMKILLVLHTPPGGFSSRTAPATHRVFNDDAFRNRIKTVWQEIATRYRDSKAIYGFDLLNEPAIGSRSKVGFDQWNTLAQELVAIVRAAAPTQKIVIEPVYGNPDLFRSLRPIKDTNVAYSFHSYFTSQFRNQGLNGRLANVPYPKGKFNRNALAKSVQGAVKFVRKNKGVSIIAGEFAAPRWAPKQGALNYLRDSINIFEKNRWDWANHAWREADIWSMEHTDNLNDPNPSAVITDRQRMFENFFKRNS